MSFSFVVNVSGDRVELINFGVVWEIGLVKLSELDLVVELGDVFIKRLADMGGQCCTPFFEKCLCSRRRIFFLVCGAVTARAGHRSSAVVVLLVGADVGHVFMLNFE